MEEREDRGREERKKGRRRGEGRGHITVGGRVH